MVLENPLNLYKRHVLLLEGDLSVDVDVRQVDHRVDLDVLQEEVLLLGNAEKRLKVHLLATHHVGESVDFSDFLVRSVRVHRRHDLLEVVKQHIVRVKSRCSFEHIIEKLEPLFFIRSVLFKQESQHQSRIN